MARKDLVTLIPFTIPKEDEANLRRNNTRVSMLHAMNAEAQIVLKKYKETVSNWSKKPKFERSLHLTYSEISITVWTDDFLYPLIDSGTKARDIVAKSVQGAGGSYRRGQIKLLKIPKFYSPKSMPSGQIIPKASPGVLPGGGKAYTYAPGPVHFPGVAARNFSKIINSEAEETLTKNVTNFFKDEINMFVSGKWSFKE